MMLSLHVFFHQEVGEEVNIHRGQHKSRIFTAPVGLLFYRIQSWSEQAAKLLRYIVKDLQKMLVPELNHVAQDDEERFGIVIHQFLYSGSQILETPSG